MGWPGVEPGRSFELQIFAPLRLSPPSHSQRRLQSGLCLDRGDDQFASVGRARPVSTPSLECFEGLARRCHALASREFTDFERIPQVVSSLAAQESQVCCVCLFHHHPDGTWATHARR